MRKGLAVVPALLLVSIAAAQTKVTGTVTCKPDKQNSVEVGDKAGHVMVLQQSKCTWTKPLEFDSVASKEDSVSLTVEQNGEQTTSNGFGWMTLANGDNMLVRLQSKGAAKGADMTDEGKWTIRRATGKLRGITGSGTFKCKGTRESQTCEVEGEYQRGKPAEKKK